MKDPTFEDVQELHTYHHTPIKEDMRIWYTHIVSLNYV